MGFLKKVGKAMGHAVAEAGRRTAAAVKRKKLQNKVERMILERFTTKQLKQIIKENNLPGPELPERGYFKKSDYVEYAYRHLKLKTVIQWAQRRRIKIKDIMDYYIAEMDKIDRQYGKTKDEDLKQGVEDIDVNVDDFEAPETYSPQLPPPPPEISTSRTAYGWENNEWGIFEDILNKIRNQFGSIIRDLKIVDEREFQNQLYLFLKSHYPDMDIAQRVDWRADILIDGKYALELKYADNRGTLDKGIREIKHYKKHTPYIAIIMLDVGKLHPEIIDEYIEYYEDEGAKVIVLKGRGSRKRNR